MASWWAEKTRQAVGHLRATVAEDERADLAGWLTPAQLGLYDAMHVADRRHGLDVVARLRVVGMTGPEILVAGLLHDCAKGETGVLPRIAYSLGQRYGRWIWRLGGLVPGWSAALHRLEIHAEASAQMAISAGCSARTADLIRYQDEPRDPDAGEALRLADEAS